MEQLASIFGAVEKLSPFGFFVRVLGVAVLLYLAGIDGSGQLFYSLATTT